MYKEIKLYSKRNKVVRIHSKEGSLILKTFHEEKDMIHEREILTLLKESEVNVPAIIKISENSILLEDLGDLTLLSWYESLEKQGSYDYEKMLNKLCSWLKKFYFATEFYYKKQYVLWDVNFRNFIIKNNDIYGIDFEQTCQGNIVGDIGKLTSYAFTYDPEMTEWKIRFRDKFIDVLSDELMLNKELIINEEQTQLAKIKERRKR